MKINGKRLLIAAGALITAGIIIAGIGYAIVRGDERSTQMENQSYTVSDIQSIRINTDMPHVVLTPVDGNQINLSWQTDEYIEYRATLENGVLDIEYRFGDNWLKSALLSLFVHNEYILEIELPNEYAGALQIQTVSGKLIAETSAALDSCSLKTVSGKISAVNITSKGDIEVRSTSGGINVESVQAAGDLYIQSVSGTVALMKSTAQGGMQIKTTSGSVTAAELNVATGVSVKTTSGKAELSQLECGGDMTMESVSGSLRPADVSCQSFTAKAVSGSISFHGLTAGNIELKNTSGSISGSISGKRADYSITASTVSGKSNLQNATGSGDKTLKLSTVSGSIDVQFDGGN